MGEGIGEQEMEELVPECGLRRDKGAFVRKKTVGLLWAITLVVVGERNNSFVVASDDWWHNKFSTRVASINVA